MATITGSTGSTITTVNVGSNDQNGTASALSAAISAALRAGTLTQAGTGTAQTPVYTEYKTPGTIPLNAAQTATVINTTGPATVIGSGSLGEQILGNGSNILLSLRGGGGTIVLGDGNDTVNTNAFLTNNGFNITTGAGNDVIFATTGNNTVNAGGGRNTIGLGNGANTVSLNGLDTLYGAVTGGGSETVLGGTGAAVIFPGSSSLYFIGGAGSTTVAGTTGGETIFAGSGGGVFVGGSAGQNSMLNGKGGASTLVGAASGDTLYATGTGITSFVAGIGNETLDGSTSSAANTFFGATNGSDVMGLGSGNNVAYLGSNSYVSAGRGGIQTIIAQANRTSGLVQIAGFNAGVDRFSFQGYSGTAFTSGIVGAGNTGTVGNTVSISGVNSTQIALGNGTTIQFLGVTNLSATNFV